MVKMIGPKILPSARLPRHEEKRDEAPDLAAARAPRRRARTRPPTLGRAIKRK